MHVCGVTSLQVPALYAAVTALDAAVTGLTTQVEAQVRWPQTHTACTQHTDTQNHVWEHAGRAAHGLYNACVPGCVFALICMHVHTVCVCWLLCVQAREAHEASVAAAAHTAELQQQTEQLREQLAAAETQRDASVAGEAALQQQNQELLTNLASVQEQLQASTAQLAERQTQLEEAMAILNAQVSITPHHTTPSTSGHR